MRPIFHRNQDRIEAHIFVAFLAYCLQVTLKANLRPLASGIKPREVIAKFKTMQMVDVCIPTTDGREFMLSRYTQPEADHRVLLQRCSCDCPSSRRRRSRSHKHASKPRPQRPCSEDLRPRAESNQALGTAVESQLRKTG